MAISVASRAGAQLGVPAGRLAPALRRLVRSTLALEKRRAGEVAIVLADDALLRDLNHRYRGLDRATDVLSFTYGEENGLVAGDIVVSMDRARAQAKRFRVGVGRELARLVVHGALHLAGLDHHAPAERRHMRRREKEALRAGAPWIRAAEKVLERDER